jgi:hypothetical protein
LNIGLNEVYVAPADDSYLATRNLVSFPAPTFNGSDAWEVAVNVASASVPNVSPKAAGPWARFYDRRNGGVSTVITSFGGTLWFLNDDFSETQQNIFDPATTRFGIAFDVDESQLAHYLKNPVSFQVVVSPLAISCESSVDCTALDTKGYWSGNNKPYEAASFYLSGQGEAPVPEPATFVISAGALITLATLRRNRRRARPIS